MARRSAYRWNDWRVSQSGESIKSRRRKRRKTGPTGKQMKYLKVLARRLGEPTPRPATKTEASSLISEMKGRLPG